MHNIGKAIEMLRRKFIVALSLLVATAMVPMHSFAAGEVAPDEMTGLDVGAKIPDFSLKDQNGQEIGLQDLLDVKGTTVFVFHRSANWWPYCKKQLGQLQKDDEALKAAGINQVAISYDSIEVLKRFADKNKISYPMLSDSGSTLIDAFGIRNKAMDGKMYGKNDLTGVPHPGTYVLSKDGVILGKLFMKKYQERHDNKELIKLVGEVVK